MLKDIFQSKTRILLVILLAALLIHAITVFRTGWEHPVTELQSLRQSLTATNTYWLKQGRPFFSCETPVFGHPWSIPLEFPIYQLLVAQTSTLFNQHLDQSGRLINIMFYLLTFIPLFLILKNLGISFEGRLITLCLFLASPLYLYWSRTFMIESTALFFSTLYLSLVLSYTKSKKYLYIITASIIGTIGILTKATTFVLFFIPAGYFMWLDWKKNEGLSFDWRVIRKKTLLFFFLVIIPVVSVLLWINHSDTLKSEGDYTIWLSSDLARWSSGTFSQRFSPFTWKVITTRALYDILGPNKHLALPFWIVMFLIFFLYFKQIKNKMTLFIFIIAYFSAFFLLTNAHVIHSYYQYANTIFFIIAVGLFLHALLSIKKKKLPEYLAVLLVVVFITSGIYGYYNRYSKFHKKMPFHSKQILKISKFIKKVTKPDEVIAIHSTWNHIEISYYSQRRSVNLKWSPYDYEGFQRALGGHPLGALLIYKDNIEKKSKLINNLKLQYLTETESVPYFIVFYKKQK